MKITISQENSIPLITIQTQEGFFRPKTSTKKHEELCLKAKKYLDKAYELGIKLTEGNLNRKIKTSIKNYVTSNTNSNDGFSIEFTIDITKKELNRYIYCLWDYDLIHNDIIKKYPEYDLNNKSKLRYDFGEVSSFAEYRERENGNSKSGLYCCISCDFKNRK